MVDEKASTSGFTDSFLAETMTIIELLDSQAIEAMAARLAQMREAGGRLFILGNGGGAAHASHAVNDFRKIALLEAYSPSDNVAELTARVNDEGWDVAYLHWLQGSRLRASDVVMVISVGGGAVHTSNNLALAVTWAKEVGATVLGIVGRDGGVTARKADICVVIPEVNGSRVTAQTESVQALVWHVLVSHPLLRQTKCHWEEMTPERASLLTPPEEVLL